MTLLEAATAIGAGVVGALGAGGLPKVVAAIAAWRRRKAEADRDVVVRALDELSAEREETGRHVDGLVRCEQRCASLAAENAELRARVEALEAELAWLRRAVQALMDGDRESAAVAKVTPIGRAKERA